MDSEINIVFALLRGALEDTVDKSAFGGMSTQQWWGLFRVMRRNHVAALTAETMATLEVPREVKIPWLAERDKAVRWYRYQLEVQQDIIGHMSRHSIETLVLKGTHTAQYYPQPELREFGDLDLYFYDKHDEADTLAVAELGVAVGRDSHHHSKYNYRGITVESHYDFINIHYPPSNRSYEALLKGLAPSSTFEVLFLLRHMACHFAASRITLRDLVDWKLTCRTLHDKIDWSIVQDTIKQYGMESFADALNAIIEQRFGTQPLSRSDTQSLIERDIVYGSTASDDNGDDGFGRLGWKLRRWRANRWKRRLVFNDSEASVLFASLTSHAEKPASILHKM